MEIQNKGFLIPIEKSKIYRVILNGDDLLTIGEKYGYTKAGVSSLLRGGVYVTKAAHVNILRDVHALTILRLEEYAENLNNDYYERCLNFNI